MHIFEVASTNPQFSFILEKNPETISSASTPWTRELRKGNIYGWFPSADNQIFRVLFVDHPTEVSFSDKFSGFEYLDTSRYFSPLLPFSLIDKAFGSSIKTRHAADTSNYEYSAKFGMFSSENIIRAAAFYKQAGITIEFTPAENCDGLYYVTAKGDCFQQLMAAIQVISILSAVKNAFTYVTLKEEMLVKVLRLLKASKVNYLMMHLFCVNAFSNRETFTKLLPAINSTVPGAIFNFGNNQTQRFDAISAQLRNSSADVLVDLGCGELSHAIKLESKYDAIIAVEADPDTAKYAENKVKVKKLDSCITVVNATVCEMWIKENASILSGADVLISEVLEHNSLEESKKILRALVMSDAATICATVPCSQFNQHYAIPEGEFRHEDHKWEPSHMEWLKICLDANSDSSRTLRIFGIGDCVNGSHSSLMAIFEASTK